MREPKDLVRSVGGWWFELDGSVYMKPDGRDPILTAHARVPFVVVVLADSFL